MKYYIFSGCISLFECEAEDPIDALNKAKKDGAFEPQLQTDSDENDSYRSYPLSTIKVLTESEYKEIEKEKEDKAEKEKGGFKVGNITLRPLHTWKEMAAINGHYF